MIYYVAAAHHKRMLRILMLGPFDTWQQAARMIQPARVAAIRCNHEMIGADYHVFQWHDHQCDPPAGDLELTALDPWTVVEASQKGPTDADPSLRDRATTIVSVRNQTAARTV